MNHLYRELAPIADAAWDVIDDEAKSRLKTYLAGRQLVDFHGPHGWDHSSVNLGRTVDVAAGESPDGVQVRSRSVLPLVEFRVPFTVARAELEAVSRGATEIDLDDLDRAARQIALAENAAIFDGFAPGGIVGIAEASTYEPVPGGLGVEHYPQQVATAVRMLLEAGVSGPFGLALSSEAWTQVVESAEHGGYPLFEHLRKAIVGGPIVWAPGVSGGVVVAQRGGDYRFESGQDLSIGYSHHDAEQVVLYLEESFTFKVDTPDAAVILRLG